MVISDFWKWFLHADGIQRVEVGFWFSCTLLIGTLLQVGPPPPPPTVTYTENSQVITIDDERRVYLDVGDGRWFWHSEDGSIKITSPLHPFHEHPNPDCGMCLTNIKKQHELTKILSGLPATSTHGH